MNRKFKIGDQVKLMPSGLRILNHYKRFMLDKHVGKEFNFFITSVHPANNTFFEVSIYVGKTIATYIWFSVYNLEHFSNILLPDE